MSTIEPAADQFSITKTNHKRYTLTEAVDYMKSLDKQPTNRQISWVNAHTGKSVTIGYT